MMTKYVLRRPRYANKNLGQDVFGHAVQRGALDSVGRKTYRELMGRFRADFLRRVQVDSKIGTDRSDSRIQKDLVAGRMVSFGEGDFICRYYGLLYEELVEHMLEMREGQPRVQRRLFAHSAALGRSAVIAFHTRGS